MPLEQLGLEPLGALEPPARGDDPLRERGLKRAFRRQFLEQRHLEFLERGGVLIRQYEVFARENRA